MVEKPESVVERVPFACYSRPIQLLRMKMINAHEHTAGDHILNV